MSLPAFKGSTFHGALGHALNHISPTSFEYFYKPHPPTYLKSQGQALPKPFLLIPPLEEKEYYEPGDIMQFGLTLFGKAIPLFMVAFTAFEYIGSQMGLGSKRARFSIQAVTQLTLQEPLTLFYKNQWLGQPSPIDLADIFQNHFSETEKIKISLITRLRLKNNNRLVRSAPSFRLFMDRLLGRINTLAAIWNENILLDRQEKHNLITLAESVQTQNGNVCWQDWTRRSGMDGRAMKFGGLLGEIIYKGELAPFLPWLALGQWTGIGGKTSFGLGIYEMEMT